MTKMQEIRAARRRRLHRQRLWTRRANPQCLERSQDRACETKAKTRQDRKQTLPPRHRRDERQRQRTLWV